MQERFIDVVPHLTHLYDLFRSLQKARKARGAIDFDMPETKLFMARIVKLKKLFLMNALIHIV